MRASHRLPERSHAPKNRTAANRPELLMPQSLKPAEPVMRAMRIRRSCPPTANSTAPDQREQMVQVSCHLFIIRVPSATNSNRLFLAVPPAPQIVGIVAHGAAKAHTRNSLGIGQRPQHAGGHCEHGRVVFGPNQQHRCNLLCHIFLSFLSLSAATLAA